MSRTIDVLRSSEPRIVVIVVGRKGMNCSFLRGGNCTDHDEYDHIPETRLRFYHSYFVSGIIRSDYRQYVGAFYYDVYLIC